LPRIASEARGAELEAYRPEPDALRTMWTIAGVYAQSSSYQQRSERPLNRVPLPFSKQADER